MVSEYTVIVETGNIKRAGTNADVFIVLIGTLGRSSEKILSNVGRDDFDRGQIDSFRIYSDDVGDMTKIQ